MVTSRAPGSARGPRAGRDGCLSRNILRLQRHGSGRPLTVVQCMVPAGTGREPHVRRQRLPRKQSSRSRKGSVRPRLDPEALETLRHWRHELRIGASAEIFGDVALHVLVEARTGHQGAILGTGGALRRFGAVEEDTVLDRLESLLIGLRDSAEVDAAERLAELLMITQNADPVGYDTLAREGWRTPLAVQVESCVGAHLNLGDRILLGGFESLAFGEWHPALDVSHLAIDAGETGGVGLGLLLGLGQVVRVLRGV